MTRPLLRALDRSLLEQPAHAVAPQLLNLLIACGERVGRIVEVEAYGGTDDPASHAHRGPTPRATIMFDRPGLLYVYRSYGVHWCANVVAHRPSEVGAVLIRAIEPIAGLEQMWAARPAARRPQDLGSGPGKLCQALGINDEHLGTDLLEPGAAVRLVRDGADPPAHPVIGTRIGISVGLDHPWRFSVPGSCHRSRRW